MPKSWFSFKNTAETEAEVSIYDVIGLWGVSAKAFVAELKKHSGKKLTVRINSPGGSVTEGLAIFNALKRHKGGVVVEIDALCASMATYIALAGAPVRMAENSFFMIHNVSGSAYGTADEMRRAAEVCEKLQKTIVAAYVAKTGKTTEEVEEKMDEETWFSAEEALDFGFIDEITDAVEAAACLSEDARALVGKFRNAPAELVDSVPQGKPEHKASAPMKILTASLAALLSTASGSALTETSNEADITAAINALSGKVTALEGEKVTLTGQVTALETDKNDLTAKLGTAEAKVTKLEGESKTTDQKALELAAAHGSAGAPKGKDEAQGGATDGKALFDAYKKLTGREAAAFWKANEKALMAYAEAEETKARRND